MKNELKGLREIAKCLCGIDEIDLSEAEHEIVAILQSYGVAEIDNTTGVVKLLKGVVI